MLPIRIFTQILDFMAINFLDYFKVAGRKYFFEVCSSRYYSRLCTGTFECKVQRKCQCNDINYSQYLIEQLRLTALPIHINLLHHSLLQSKIREHHCQGHSDPHCEAHIGAPEAPQGAIVCQFIAYVIVPYASVATTPMALFLIILHIYY